MFDRRFVCAMIAVLLAAGPTRSQVDAGSRYCFRQYT